MQRNGKVAQADAATPEAVAMTPEANGMMPEAFATTSQVDATAPQAFATTSQADAIAPQAFATAPQAFATTSQVDATTSQAPVRSQFTLGYRANGSIEQRLLAAKVAIEGVLADPALQSALTPYGYDLAGMQQGKALLDQAQALAQQQRARMGNQRRATDTRDTTQAQAHAFYMRQVAIARVALRRDRGAAEALDLAAARKRTLAGWLMQAQQFYANALNDAAILTKLAAHGLTTEQLEHGQAQVEAVAASAVTHQQRKDVKQEATRARDAALQALNDWMRDFTAIARVALADLA
jgi:hypothetical protein